MTAAEARARIEDDTQWQSAPALSAAEVDRLLARAEAGGLSEDAVARAVAAGWRMKAGKAQYDVKAGTTEAKRSQMAEIALDMAREHDPAGTGFGGATMDVGFVARDAGVDEYGRGDRRW